METSVNIRFQDGITIQRSKVGHVAHDVYQFIVNYIYRILGHDIIR